MNYQLVVEFRPPDALHRLDEWRAVNAAALNAVPEEAVIFDTGRVEPSGTFVRVRVAAEHIPAFREAFVGNSPKEDPAKSEAFVLVFVGDIRRKSLVGIAAYADAINRDYLAEPDFREAVDRLAARGLISVDEAGIEATKSGKTLLKETKARSWIDQAHEITRRLSELPVGDIRAGLVREGAYAAAINQYFERSRSGQTKFL